MMISSKPTQVTDGQGSSRQRGAVLLTVHRSSRRAAWFWVMAIGGLMAGLLDIVAALDPQSPDRARKAMAATWWILNGAMWSFVIWKSQNVPIVTFTEEGFVVADGLGQDLNFVPWARLRRWTWNHVPQLQLNLFDGNYVFNFQIPAALQESVEQIVRSRIAASQVSVAESTSEQSVSAAG